MLLQKRIDRAMDWLKEKTTKDKAGKPATEGEVHLEKGDMPAMILSAMLIFLPIALLVLVVLSFVSGFWALL